MWELLGGFIAMLLKSTKLFWQMQPLKYKFYYVLLHSWHGIFWFMILKVDIRFCAVYFLYLASSTILLLKIKASVVNVVALLLTFGGLILCNYMENFYSPFPFGFEWVVYLLYLKLIFAFTINYKIYDA
jgi:hypothetical protein